MTDTALIPLVLVAAETGADADELAATLDGAIELDAALIRCIPTHMARRIVTDHHAAVMAERDRTAAKREAARQQRHPTRERVRALRRQQAKWEAVDGVPAFGVMTADSIEASADANARRMDEMLAGDLIRHPIRQEGDQ